MADLTLGDDGFLVVVQIFDGIFQRDDMGVPGLVDPVDDAGQGCGFSASRCSCYQNHAFFHGGNVKHCLRNVDVCRIWQIKPYNSYDGCQRTSLLHHTCAESGQPHNGKGEVVVSLLLNAGHISVSADGVNFPDIIVHFSREYLFFAYRLDPAVDFHGQRHSWNQENVRGLFSYGVLKKFFNIHNEPLCLKAAWADYSAVVSAPSGPVHTGSRVSMA